MAYFDWNATAPLLEEAREAWLAASDVDWANPSTSYRRGVRARLALDEAREELAAIAGCRPGQVVFTSGATEANNAVIREAARGVSDGRIWISAVEHPSVREAARHWWGGDRMWEMPVDGDGRVDPEQVREHLRQERPGLVSLMAANNETGVIQPWEAVRDHCREAGIPFHCDAVQWFGKAGSADWDGCAGVTLSGHKFGGPKGTGALILSDQGKGMLLQAGGAQEWGSRAGTEDIPGIVAMVAALRARASRGIDPSAKCARDRFEEAILQRWPGEIRIHGSGAERLWNTCSIALPEFRSDRWIARLDRLGFEVSSGSACSTGKEGPSAVLAAMGIPGEAIRRTIRISSGWETTPADWENLLGALLRAREDLAGDQPPKGPGTVIEI